MLGPRIVVIADGEDDRGKREHDVHRAHQNRLDPLAGVARDQADERPGRDREADRDEADPDRDARAVDDAREDVAAQLVGAEPVRAARGLRALREVLPERVVRARRAARTPPAPRSRRSRPRRRSNPGRGETAAPTSTANVRAGGSTAAAASSSVGVVGAAMYGAGCTEPRPAMPSRPNGRPLALLGGDCARWKAGAPAAFKVAFTNSPNEVVRLLHELRHHAKAGLRSALACALLLAFVLCSMPSAFAQTVTGTIQGTITSSSQANTKLAGVAVAAVAPSGRYVATTDQNGFFTMQGVSSDTYSVTFTRTGYETFTLSGVTVSQGQIANVSAALNQSLTRIGRTQPAVPRARSSRARPPTSTTSARRRSRPSSASREIRTKPICSRRSRARHSTPAATPCCAAGASTRKASSSKASITPTPSRTSSPTRSSSTARRTSRFSRAPGTRRSATPARARSTWSRSAARTRTSASWRPGSGPDLRARCSRRVRFGQPQRPLLGVRVGLRRSARTAVRPKRREHPRHELLLRLHQQ